MCDCCRDATVISAVDNSKIRTASQNVVDLLKNDVFLVVFDNEWESIWDFASSQSVMSEFREQLPRIHTMISGGEEAIRQLNSGWRVDELLSFKLNCHSSRIFVFLLTESYRLVIVNKYNSEEELPSDGPEVDQRLKEICATIKSSINALNPAHV